MVTEFTKRAYSPACTGPDGIKFRYPEFLFYDVGTLTPLVAIAGTIGIGVVRLVFVLTNAVTIPTTST